MALKHYTLYFKGKNEYGHEHNIPIITLELKKLDEYTSRYNGYLELYKSFCEELRNYIEENFNYMIDFNDEKSLSEHFFITDNDFNPIMDVIFKGDSDVLYISQNDLIKLILDKKMSFQEFQMAHLKSSLNKSGSKYKFFKCLYQTYVKDQKVSCMIDVYDVNRAFLNFSYDELMTAAIATDRDNIIVICKKIGQFLQTRRNLAFEFKKIFKIKNLYDLIPNGYIKEDNINELNMDDIKEKIIESLNKFKIKYNKEYNR